MLFGASCADHGVSTVTCAESRRANRPCLRNLVHWPLQYMYLWYGACELPCCLYQNPNSH